ncbi:transglutaminase-like cysteine peptidase [Rhizobium sp. 16-449-1b]|uniref:transglutaminase-like cysteine peptidase n=1 Tax=Rhizobium sp. 16-449-1b TaxID=2819989 RepID=UPI001AD9F401|nr:transglutaminase-like cysteine peptidase [Rhizobium sp. 16-449-1b]MBO9197055.1 transglutaminase-like cysteine peptidase [Rhizobium sp. 16-449-1b]
MRRIAAILSFVMSIPLISGQSFAGSEIPASRSISPPVGFGAACAKYGWVCHGKGGVDIGDKEALRALQEVNRFVNSKVKPTEDRIAKGRRSDNWTLPVNNKGDCEDYALLKMKTLLDIGFPTSKLALSVVLDRSGENHLVLIARLKSGDYVLDNLAYNVKPWQRTGYTFLASQNFNSKANWQVTLAGPRASQFIKG